MANQFDGAAFGREIVVAVRGYLERELGDIKKRLAEVEARTLRYVGTHTDGKVYQPGEMVSHGGSLWHCECTTVSRPGTDSSWRLALKRGEFSR
jgi:hypothetical protein